MKSAVLPAPTFFILPYHKPLNTLYPYFSSTTKREIATC